MPITLINAVKTIALILTLAFNTLRVSRSSQKQCQKGAKCAHIFIKGNAYMKRNAGPSGRLE